MDNIRELFQMTIRRFHFLDKNSCSTGVSYLSLTQSHILYEIDRQHQPSMQQVADALGIDITTFSRQVQTLVKMNLVKKTPLPQDKRVMILSLTVEGKYVTTTVDRTISEYLNEIFSHMNEFEKETVIRSLELLNSAMIKTEKCYSPTLKGE
ncbi:MarR family transcriptional regulator [Shimazuella alba]|uniref:MarR family transcriptional regulator n=1 Tax=Shimazuella alba TaxID=2690964 RepID=A0A6I4VQQ9_9BACL|nr:MarR family transcriptional regulator [Shimazuella alba]